MPEALSQPIDTVLKPGEHMTSVLLPGKLPGGSVLARIELCIEDYLLERTVSMVLQQVEQSDNVWPWIFRKC